MTTRPNRLPRAGASLLLALAAAAGCASPASAPAASTARSAGADPGPAASSRMVCTGDAVEEIAGALGTEPTSPPAATWAGHLYSCTYAYPDGSMLLSVKELADPATAAAQFDGLRGSAGQVTMLNGLGESAFTEANGSTVVRKDSSVLVVDVSRLPEPFGKPPRSRAKVSVTVATTIMTCWQEHSS